MSGIEKIAATKVIANFPAAGVLLSRKISVVTNAFNASNTQTDTLGVKQITLTPITYGIYFSWAAPNDSTAAGWFADATVDADVLQYVFIPAGVTYTKTFTTPVIRWDLLSAGAGSTAVWQEKAR